MSPAVACSSPVLCQAPLAVATVVLSQCNWAASAGCSYVAPQRCPADQGYPGMERLTDPSWTADRGRASGKQMLMYAYGPMFAGRGQIGAWSYNADSRYIEFFYSKSHCMGMCSNCCQGGGGNEPGIWSAFLNPSASSSGQLAKQFVAGEKVKLPFGEVVLRHVNGNWRLEANKCYMDHMYVCSKKEFVAKGFDASLKPCDVKFSGAGEGGGDVSMLTLVSLCAVVIGLASVAVRYMMLWLPPLRRRLPAKQQQKQQQGTRGGTQAMAKVDQSSAAFFPASHPASLQLTSYPPQYPVLAGTVPCGGAASMPAHWGLPSSMQPSSSPMAPTQSAPAAPGVGWPVQAGWAGAAPPPVSVY